MLGPARIALVPLALLLAAAAHAAALDLATVRAGYRASESLLLVRRCEPLHELRTTRRRGGSSGCRPIACRWHSLPRLSRPPSKRASGAGSGGSWRPDRRPAGDADGVALWMPAPERHRLALLDAGGREVDAARFEVRGAPYAARVR
jgi:hypothetical protein